MKFAWETLLMLLILEKRPLKPNKTVELSRSLPVLFEDWRSENGLLWELSLHKIMILLEF